MSVSSLPILIDTPHSSGHAPFHVLADMLGEAAHNPESRQERLNHLFKQGDPHTDEMFYIPNAHVVNAVVSRFVVDLNRLRDAGGMNGVIKVTDFDAKSLYCEGFEFTKELLDERLARYYDPYHNTLDRILEKHDIAYFISGHAMAANGPLIGPDIGTQRPAICIITNGDLQGNRLSQKEHNSIPAEIANNLVEILNKHFKDIIANSDVPKRVSINDPFNNAGIAKRLSDPRHKNMVPGFGLELNQNLYLEQHPSKVLPIAGRIKIINERLQAFMLEIIPMFEALKKQREVTR